MKVKELINRLEQEDPEREIMILDGFNGGGYPRTINLPPVRHIISNKEWGHCADCEDIGPGVAVVVMGYGCY